MQAWEHSGPFPGGTVQVGSGSSGHTNGADDTEEQEREDAEDDREDADDRDDDEEDGVQSGLPPQETVSDPFVHVPPVQKYWSQLLVQLV
jgi:hypothetical protein